jgi:hypothetical protein
MKIVKLQIKFILLIFILVMHLAARNDIWLVIASKKCDFVKFKSTLN